jgi:hypothetical protein
VGEEVQATSAMMRHHGPNQAMQPTARRRTASLSMTKKLLFQARLAVTSGG